MFNPVSEVSEKETVGRRAFGTSVFVCEKPLAYNFSVFLDDRTEDNLSVDRLGIRPPDKEAALAYLKPLGQQMGEKRKKAFSGWAQISARDVMKIGIKKTDAEGEDNIYHAEISRKDHVGEQAQISLAFRLKVFAEKNDFLSGV